MPVYSRRVPANGGVNFSGERSRHRREEGDAFAGQDRGDAAGVLPGAERPGTVEGIEVPEPATGARFEGALFPDDGVLGVGRPEEPAHQLLAEPIEVAHGASVGLRGGGGRLIAVPPD